MRPLSQSRVSWLRRMSLHGDTQAGADRDEETWLGSVLLKIGGNEESVFEGGGSMDRQQSMSAGDASSGDLDVSKIPTLKPALRKPARSAGSTSANTVQNARPQPMADRPSSSQRTLTDAQVLKLLESRRAGTATVVGEAIGSSDVTMLPPEDTNTRLVLREAVARNAPVSFAVQLQWSVQPINIKSVPRHPIFQAYALYAAEGRRAGRTWFFLRVGFFSDAVSAKQVAHYLRRDFASAAVVPVSPQEREQVMQRGRCSEAATVARPPA